MNKTASEYVHLKKLYIAQSPRACREKKSAPLRDKNILNRNF